MNTIKTNYVSKKNLGIQILRMILCFWVVIEHCLKQRIYHYYKRYFKIRLHVPCFFLISYFFSFQTISNRDLIKINKRFERLLIPYIVFPIIILFINNISYINFKKSFLGKILTGNDLIIQYNLFLLLLR